MASAYDKDQCRRLNYEKTLIDRYFPAFIWKTPYVIEGNLKTNDHFKYTVRLVLTPDYPSGRPSAYIIWPCPLSGPLGENPNASYAMHTLWPDQDGHVQVCHYPEENWDEGLTLTKVLWMIRLWLEAYEASLDTGNTIDYYLSHMDTK